MSEQKLAGRPTPKPNVYVDTTPFWNGVREGKLVLQFCPETKQFQHYPRPVSIYTGKRNIEWRQVSGKGTIYACTTIRIPGPGLEGRLPLCVATVDLDEGVRFIGNVLNCAPEQVTIGARVKLAWDRLNEDSQYPAFELA
jgi:uncharacterized OB-fold protein